jgi:O-antigen/teichoic acid export membrane protein
MKVKAETKTSILVAGFRICGVGAQALTFAVLANGLPPQQVGEFSACYLLWTFVRMLGPLGFDQIAMREIPRALNMGDDAGIAALCNYTNIVVVSANIAFVGLMIAIAPMAAHFHVIADVTYSEVFIALMACPAYAIVGLLTGQLYGYRRNIEAQLFETFGFNWLHRWLVADRHFDLNGRARRLSHRDMATGQRLYLGSWRVEIAPEGHAWEG